MTRVIEAKEVKPESKAKGTGAPRGAGLLVGVRAPFNECVAVVDGVSVVLADVGTCLGLWAPQGF
jgi:hypothetical protein